MPNYWHGMRRNKEITIFVLDIAHLAQTIILLKSIDQFRVCDFLKIANTVGKISRIILIHELGNKVSRGF